MTRHPFTPAAKPLWDTVPPDAQEHILKHVWCGHCLSGQRILDFTGVEDAGDIILRGFCQECGHVIVRLIETSQAPPRR